MNNENLLSALGRNLNVYELQEAHQQALVDARKVIKAVEHNQDLALSIFNSGRALQRISKGEKFFIRNLEILGDIIHLEVMSAFKEKLTIEINVDYFHTIVQD